MLGLDNTSCGGGDGVDSKGMEIQSMASRHRMNTIQEGHHTGHRAIAVVNRCDSPGCLALGPCNGGSLLPE